MKIHWGKILLSVMGMLFTLYSVLIFALNVAGISTEARLTSYQQEYGERDEVIRNRYTYLFSYEFEVDGKTYFGNGQRVAGPVYLKPSGDEKIQIRYLPIWPYLNQAEDEGFDWVAVLYLGIGLGLLTLGFRKEKKNLN